MVWELRQNCRKFENNLITTLNGKNEIANKNRGKQTTINKAECASGLANLKNVKFIAR